MSFIQFLDASVIGSVLGSVIPSVIGFAAYLCNFFLKLKQKGWRNLNEQDWKELGQQIEKEFNLVSSVFKSTHENHCCEHCQKSSEKLLQDVQKVKDQIDQSRSNLMTRANDKVAENLPPKTNTSKKITK
ncbi:hypothetical protein OVS_03775 [Mycoplasma ovis str. Michigan]|uniref:Uncharacterized protein n=1 Tax=Mycoplasma ovis str. Michigan TaxID=1415773 RepID=A0ABN4BQB1_9MOLU|nr:hypothetical protein [Mycoplasma ovis]AHC40053.1 hypothetical protein OVS_03775 [Mycoplasma ovis str. Michigan]